LIIYKVYKTQLFSFKKMTNRNLKENISWYKLFMHLVALGGNVFYK